MKLVLQYRWGLLPTQRWLHKCKLSPNPNCTLCGEPDGGHHAISACKALNKAAIKRHNDAGTAIVEAICKGEHAARLMLADVGIRQRKTQNEIDAMCRSATSLQFCRYIKDADIPCTIPATLREALKTYRGSIPDALIYDHEELPLRRYIIVEIKYCRDTDPRIQQARAETQHQALIDLIRENDTDAAINLVPIMLGVSGTIYNDFLEAADNRLGITGTAKATLAKRLHLIVVTHVLRYTRTSRHKEKKHESACLRHAEL